jgi:hypothetical protein
LNLQLVTNRVARGRDRFSVAHALTSLAIVSSTGDVFYNIKQVYEQAKANGYKGVRRALRFRLSELEDAGFLKEKLKHESYRFGKPTRSTPFSCRAKLGNFFHTDKTRIAGRTEMDLSLAILMSQSTITVVNNRARFKKYFL